MDLFQKKFLPHLFLFLFLTTALAMISGSVGAHLIKTTDLRIIGLFGGLIASYSFLIVLVFFTELFDGPDDSFSLRLAAIYIIVFSIVQPLQCLKNSHLKTLIWSSFICCSVASLTCAVVLIIVFISAVIIAAKYKNVNKGLAQLPLFRSKKI